MEASVNRLSSDQVRDAAESSGETQVSLTDPDARAMATTSKQSRVVGYNVQSVVETKHHLIVAHERQDVALILDGRLRELRAQR